MIAEEEWDEVVALATRAGHCTGTPHEHQTSHEAPKGGEHCLHTVCDLVRRVLTIDDQYRRNEALTRARVLEFIPLDWSGQAGVRATLRKEHDAGHHEGLIGPRSGRCTVVHDGIRCPYGEVET